MKKINIAGKGERRVKVFFALVFLGAGGTLGVISFFSSLPFGWGFTCAVVSAILFMVSLSEAEDRIANLELQLMRQKSAALRASDHDIISSRGVKIRG